jgi:hypothetical protein
VKRNLKCVRDLANASPFSENTLRWMIFNAASNGHDAAGAVVRVGRRVYFDVDAFDRWIDANCTAAVKQ